MTDELREEMARRTDAQQPCADPRWTEASEVERLRMEVARLRRQMGEEDSDEDAEC